MACTLKDIPPLLHDARLSGCRWDNHLKTLHLCFQCLRRNVDGTPIADNTVDLKLAGVERLVAYYSPANVLVKPSAFKLGSRITLADLEDWHGSVDANLAINSPQSEFEAATSCVRETLFGESGDDVLGECELQVHVSFEPHQYGLDAATTSLCISCDTLEPLTNGIPLDIETWQDQYAAWWKGWRDHWSKKGNDEVEGSEPAFEDTVIPARKSDPPDLSYRPPLEAPFSLPPTSVPAELLKPIEDYHTGVHERDWLKVALAYQFFDYEPVERAARLRDQFLGYNFGRWVYVRHIDGWWCEGNRACVIVRGIEHTKGNAKSPARNEETVVTYTLRKFRQTWVIATWSQGWPKYGSAKKLQEAQTWRDGWNLEGRSWRICKLFVSHTFSRLARLLGIGT
jgi:hypothetical protein